MNENRATLLNPKSGKKLAQISLEGELIQANTLLSASGNLQSFLILSVNGELQEAWFDQQAILLRTGNIQQLVKIVTYPTDGENQGHLEIIQGSREYYNAEEEPQPKHQIRRGLAVLQTLLGA